MNTLSPDIVESASHWLNVADSYSRRKSQEIALTQHYEQGGTVGDFVEPDTHLYEDVLGALVASSMEYEETIKKLAAFREMRASCKTSVGSYWIDILPVQLEMLQLEFTSGAQIEQPGV